LPASDREQRWLGYTVTYQARFAALCRKALIKYAILGPIELCDGACMVAVSGPRQQALLALLLLNANHALSYDRLIDALWGGLRPAGALKRLQAAVVRLRRTLDGEGAEDESALRTVTGGYLLTVRPGELDAEVFQTRVEDARRALEAGDTARGRDGLREALGMWRGPALTALAYEEFAQPEIRRLEELRLTALEARVDCELQLGEHRALVGELEGLVAAHPGRERPVAQLMLALYRCGRQGDALEIFARTRAYLSVELGLEPGPALKALQRGILEQAPSLDLHPPDVTESVTSTGEPQRRFALPAAMITGNQDLFVGRAADLEALGDVYAQVVGGSRRLVVLSGDPGIGKTRLATRFALRAHDEGAIVLHGRCDEEALLAQQPFVEALRHYVCDCPQRQLAAQSQFVSGELRRIVPELADRIPGLPEPLAGDPDGARSRLFEAVCSLLCEAAQNVPVVLVLDDLQWADKATLLLLKYLVRYPRPARLMVLGTYRETELDVEHPLRATLADLRRESLLEQRALAPLDTAAVSLLVSVHAGDAASPELRRLVYERTEGNAFFVVEMLRHLTESGAVGDTGAPRPDIATGQRAVPAGVKDVISRRVARLGREINRLLAAASVLGRTFELGVLERLSGLGEDELLDGLESAVHARIVEEIAGTVGRYTFSHALIRDSVYGGLTATRRALLHRRAGAALEQAHRTHIEPYLAELAYHFAQAGSSDDLVKAIEYGTRAGEHAITQLAYEQAAAHFRQTIELINAVGPKRRRHQRCDLVIAQGEAERQAGDPAFRQTLLGGARLAQELDDPERLARAALANTYGVFSAGQGVDHDRVGVLQAALDSYDVADSPTRAALLALLAIELGTDHDWRLRQSLSDDAVAMARRAGDPYTLALVLTQSSLAKLGPHTASELRTNLREAIELTAGLKDPLLAGHAACLGAHVAMQVGELHAADQMLGRLTAVAGQLGQPFLRYYDVVAQAKRRMISGPPEEAERLAFTALQIGRNTGQRDSTLTFLNQLFVARFLRGSLDHGDPHLPDVSVGPGWTPPTSPEITPSRSVPRLFDAAVSAVLCEVGRLDDARAHLDLLMSSELDDLSHDYTALAIPAYASIACARLGDTHNARRLHAILEPYSTRLVNTGASWFGATTHYLALLAVTLGRPGEADAHFTAAERTYTALDAKPWLARLHHDRDATVHTPPLQYSR
jgi:DNA-binding SARP family transcriptional activator